jgi:hypothetical protein
VSSESEWPNLTGWNLCGDEQVGADDGRVRNLTQAFVYDYGCLSTPARTYNFTYAYQQDSNYAVTFVLLPKDTSGSGHGGPVDLRWFARRPSGGRRVASEMISRARTTAYTVFARHGTRQVETSRPAVNADCLDVFDDVGESLCGFLEGINRV